jgi:hypothetical protein
MADAGQGEFNPQDQPAPDFEFDQHFARQVPMRQAASFVMG